MEGYEVICPIGQGSFSKVFKIKRKSDESIFVWKEMDFSKITEKEKSQIVAEVNILRELKHPNIVKYYDRIVDKQNAKIYIIMEYCEGGDLAQFLKKLRKQKSEFPEEAIWKILSQIILALYEIHKRKEGKILHRDIKPANIFLDSSNNVKIGDFGLARILGQESEYAQTSVGTPYYMSPELIDENKYNDKSDIWAVGCLLYEICALNPPFTAQNYLTLAMKIKQGVYQRIPQKYSNEMSRVIGWCLQKDEKNRPSVDDLLNIPQMSQRLREKRLKVQFNKFNYQIKENTQVIQRREEAIQKKEENLKDLEIRIKQRQKELEKLQISLAKNGENKENLKFGQDLVYQSWNQKKDAGYLPINQSKIELSDKNNPLNQIYEF